MAPSNLLLSTHTFSFFIYKCFLFLQNSHLEKEHKVSPTCNLLSGPSQETDHLFFIHILFSYFSKHVWFREHFQRFFLAIIMLFLYNQRSSRREMN